MSGRASTLRVRDIQLAVAQWFDIPFSELLSSIQKKRVSQPRQVAMLLSYELSTRNMSAIGRRFGRDRTTVRFGIQRARQACEHADFGEYVASLRDELRGRA